jgi:hypothetical protein
MMSNSAEQETSSGSRSPRTGTIELLQVLSLFALALAVLLFTAEHEIFAGLSTAVCVVLAAIPFWIARVPEPPRYAGWDKGFMITPERRRTLASVNVPDDILGAIDQELIGIYFQTSLELRDALFVALGEERVSPWLNTILLHAKYYGKPLRNADVPESIRPIEIAS